MSSRTVLFLFSALLIILSPLFFYRLGQSSLVSWDEAWYAEISRQILVRKNPFQLYFNDARYADHPAAGFWFTALSFSLFGINEFGARAAQAVFGLICLALVFLLGRHLFHPAVGLASALAIASSPWFIYRSRSGNLDISTTAFFLAVFLFAYLSVKNRRFLFPLSLSLIFLFLSKSLVPATILPAVFLIFASAPGFNWRSLRLPLFLFTITIIAWVLLQLPTYPNYLRQYLLIGLPGLKATSSYWQNFLLAKSYLHLGIGPLFRPAVIALGLAAIFFLRRFLPLLAFTTIFFLPFALSPKGHIWHLIPLHPFLILGLTGFTFTLVSRLSRPLALSLTLTLTLTLAVPQISRNWHEFIAIPRYVSDEAILSRAASAFPGPLYLDEDFVPAAVFYSGKHVEIYRFPDIKGLFTSHPGSLLITHAWRLERDAVPPSWYQVLASDRDKLLIQTLPITN